MFLHIRTPEVVQACHFLLASHSFPLFFTQRARQGTFTSYRSHSLNSSSIFSSPLTSSPPHLATPYLFFLLTSSRVRPLCSLCGLCRFLLLEAFLIFCPPKFLFSQSSCLCRSYPARSNSPSSRFPLCSIAYSQCRLPFFKIVYPLLLLLTSKQKLGASLAAVTPYTVSLCDCVCVCVSL